MRPGWKRRALTWLLLAESVRANRNSFRNLPTAWLPHGVGNSLLLWMPELLAALDGALCLEEQCQGSATARGIHGALRDFCVDNAAWGNYVAPSAFGYALSHPRFNIYKGDLAEVNLLGFGLDAIPHSVTAYAVARLLQDGILALDAQLPDEAPLAPLVRALARQPALLSGVVLVLLSLGWEAGEYLMQQDELRRAGGDRNAINMQWDLQDTAFDLLANTLGWLVAARQQGRPSPLE